MSRRFGGLGLGLAICKALVQQVNGSLQMESTVGVDSIFTLNIPVSILSAAKMISQEFSRGNAPKAFNEKSLISLSTKRRILIVEDSVDNQYLVQHFLNRLNLDSTTVENGNKL